MPQVRFTTFGAMSSIGGFEPGQLLRCGAEMARHLVEDCKCAVYITPPIAPEIKAEEQPVTAKRGRKARDAADAG
jgi:hypothetical protein